MPANEPRRGAAPLGKGVGQVNTLLRCNRQIPSLPGCQAFAGADSSTNPPHRDAGGKGDHPKSGGEGSLRRPVQLPLHHASHGPPPRSRDGEDNYPQ